MSDVLIQCPSCGEGLRYVTPKYAGTMTDQGFTSAEAEREEGRREVLREIAALNPERDEYGNRICPSCRHLLHSHVTGCLWLRAQAVKA